MNKIQLHEQEILEKFDEKYKEVWNSELSKFVRIPEGIKGNMLRDISDALHSQMEVIKGMVEKMMDENDDGMWLGMETAEKILALLTIHEDKTP